MQATLVKDLKPDHIVTVIYDTTQGFQHTQITAAKLIKASFGNEKLDVEDDLNDEDDEGATIVLTSLEDYNVVRTAAGAGFVQAVMGRPHLPEGKRASQQIQLRVTNEQKENYKTAAARARCFNVSEWIKATLDAAAKKC